MYNVILFPVLDPNGPAEGHIKRRLRSKESQSLIKSA